MSRKTVKDILAEEVKNKFSDLNFDEDSHSYTINGENFKSVSAFIKEHTPFFDAPAVANIIASKSDTQTIDEILEEWDSKRRASSAHGTRVHSYMENIFDFKVYPPETECAHNLLQYYIKEYWGPHPTWRPFLSELRMYHPKWKLAGTLDLAAYRCDGSVVTEIRIDDWKTNENLNKTYGKLLYPFNDIPNNPLGKYTIQQNLYALMLKEMGYEVTEARLIHSRGDTYTVIDVFDTELQNKIKEYLDNQVEQESAWRDDN